MQLKQKGSKKINITKNCFGKRYIKLNSEIFTKEKWENTQINEIKNERGEIMTDIEKNTKDLIRTLSCQI